MFDNLKRKISNAWSNPKVRTITGIVAGVTVGTVVGIVAEKHIGHEGYKQGFEKGETEGKKVGYNDGWNRGYEVGRELLDLNSDGQGDAYTAGWNDAVDERNQECGFKDLRRRLKFTDNIEAYDEYPTED